MVDVDFNIDWSRGTWIAFGLALVATTLYVLYSFIGTVVFALFIYYATRWLYKRMRRRIGPPSLAAGLSLVVLALPVVLLLLYAVAVALQELDQFSDQADLGPYLDFVQPYFDVSEIVDDPASFLADPGVVDIFQTSLNQAYLYLGIVGTGLLHLFVMFSIAYYLLRDGPRLARWVDKFDDEYAVLTTYLNAVDSSLERIFAGNLLNALSTGVIGVIAYSTLNFFATGGVAVPYPALTGLFAGLASLVPIVGMKLVYVPVSGYLAILAYSEGTGWGFVAGFVVLSVAIVDLIPDLFIRPRVSRGGGWLFAGSGEERVELHVGMLMFAYILGPLLFGWYGIFLGPIVLVAVTHFASLVLPELLAKKSIQPSAVDPSHLVEPTPELTDGADAVTEDGGEDGRTEESESRS